MSELFFSSLNIIQPIVMITFIIALVYLKKDNITSRLLIIILGCSLLSELMSVAFIVLKINYGLLYSAGIIIHNCLWIILFSHIIKEKEVLKYVILFYLGFSTANLLVFEGMGKFNNYTFVLGAFIYLSCFVISSFKELKKENFEFFYSNDYLLIVAPTSFFLGLSFYFGFKDSDLGDIKIIGEYDLYNILNKSVCTIYYGLVIIYIIRQKKIRDAKK